MDLLIACLLCVQSYLIANPIDPSPSPAAAQPCALIAYTGMYPSPKSQAISALTAGETCLQSSAAFKPSAASEPSTTPKAGAVFATVPELRYVDC